MDSLSPEELALINLGVDLRKQKSASRSRAHNNALFLSIDTSTNCFSNGKEHSSAETPPRPSAGEKDTSPMYVVDVTGKTFPVGNEGPHKRVEDGEFTCLLPVVPPRRNLCDSAEENLSDTSGGRNMTLRVRARAATVPARYRQPIKEESRTKFSTSSDRKKVVVQEFGASSMGEKTPAPKIVGKIPARKKVDSCRGIWTEAEQNLFEDGCILHGWGNWKNIQEMIPTRDRHQVKSHAQKYEKHHPEGRERFQREYERQLLLPKTEALIRTNDWKPKSETKKASCLYSVSSRDMAVTSKSDIMVVSPPETTSEQVKKSNLMKSDPPKRAGSSEDVSPCQASQVLPIQSPLLSPPTLFENETYGKSAIIVPKAGDEVPSMLAIPHGTTSAHAPMAIASKGAPPLKEGKMSPTHEANAASPPLLLSTHETNISSTAKEFNSVVADQPRKREPTTIISVEECAQPTKKKKSVHDFGTAGSGSWTNLEHMQFEKGCILFGWGNWKFLESLIPSRNSVQIKSHAQKFSKNRPYEKERLLRGHEEHERQSHIMKRDTAPIEKETGQGEKHIKSTSRRLPLSKNRKSEGWSLIEKKQFEDGCVFHGWGNWRDISSHIFTKDVSQVSAHAESYNLIDRERLEREHALHHQDDNDALIVHVEKNTKKIQHDLLLQGGKKAELGMLMQSPTKTTSNKNHDEYGAAEAILALNCSSWDKEENSKKPALAKERPTVDSKKSPKTEGASGFLQGEAKVANKVNGSIEMSAVVSLEEDQAVAKDSHMSVDTQSDKDRSMPESDEAVRVCLDDGPVMSLKVEAPIVKSAPTRPRGSQPPPHWLATDTWDMCLFNVHCWNKKLTESERNAEYLHYDHLSSSEKECLRVKLVKLMDNRPA